MVPRGRRRHAAAERIDAVREEGAKERFVGVRVVDVRGAAGGVGRARGKRRAERLGGTHVRVDESGDDDATTGVDDFGLRGNREAPTFSHDASVGDDDVGVFDGRRRERHEGRALEHDPLSHGRIVARERGVDRDSDDSCPDR